MQMTEEQLKAKLLERFMPKEMNIQILSLLAKELDVSRRDARYKALLCVPGPQLSKPVDSDEDELSFDNNER